MNDDSLREALTAQGFELIETHISRVYLRGDTVYKIKRPVDLGFLDFSSLDARARACHAEVALNRRLADGVYLGVAAVVHDARGELAFVPAEQLSGQSVLEWAVHMRRLSDEARADLRLRAGLLQQEELEKIAELLVRFHASVESVPGAAAFGSVEQVRANVEENFSQVAPLAGDHLSESDLRALESYQRAFLDQHGELFARRIEARCVRDGHGDLRLEHIYRTESGEHVIIDCIEFNERFRFADVCADLAFLSMDLRNHDRPDLAELLIATYAQESGDYELYRLIDFYESYRAFVRAKVTSLLAHDAHVSEAAQERAHTAARRYFLLSLAAARPPLSRPRLIVSMGLIASGKSTLARALSREAGLCVLSADRVRKELLGVGAHTPLHDAAFQGAYAPELTARVYETLCARAAPVLASGRSVILDATFREQRQRELALALAAQSGAEALFFECRCSRETTLERLRLREQAPSVSDGRLEVYDAVARRSEPPSELPRDRHVVLDTNRPPRETLDTALAHIR